MSPFRPSSTESTAILEGASENLPAFFRKVFRGLRQRSPESVKGIQVTQGFARESRNAELFRDLIRDHSGYNMGLARNIALYIPLLELNAQFFIAIIVVIGGYGALQPDWGMSVADLVVFFFLANLFFSPISALGRQFTNALSAVAGAERIFRLLDLKPDWQDAPDATDAPHSSKAMSLWKTSPSLTTEKNRVLHDIFLRRSGWHDDRPRWSHRQRQKHGD